MSISASFDQLLRGGRVICPASGIDGIRDVAIRNGRIAAVQSDILPTSAREVIDVTGKLVLPGLIDTHAHVYQYVTGRFGMNADMVGVHFGQLWGLPESGTNGEDVDTILERVIPLLREGDVLAHPFTRHPGGFVNREGEVHPVIQAALDRGLKVDVGHGSHFSYRLAKKAIAAGIVPTTLGADIHGYNTHVPAPAGTPEEHEDEENHPFAGQAKFSLVQAMSSMMALGLTLEQVVPMVTSNPAKMLGRSGEIGALKVGMDADISVLTEQNGRFVLRDNEKNEVIAERLLKQASCLSAVARLD